VNSNSICKTVLAHESGDPGVEFNEKNRGSKSRETVSLNKTCELHILPTLQKARTVGTGLEATLLLPVLHLFLYAPY
jgi:hypothetical protein